MKNLKSLKNTNLFTSHRKLHISIFIISSFLTSSILIYNYVINSPLTDFPTIKIVTNGNPEYEKYVNATFELKSKKLSEEVPSIDARVRLRGSGSGWNKMSPKKGYRIELTDQISLLGMRKDDDWLLFELYSDYPKTRTKLSMDLWRSLSSTNPTAILPDSKFVCVYINGDFKGLYLLAEKNDRTLFGLDDYQNNINSSLIFQAKGEKNIVPYDRTAWEQDWPNIDESYLIMDEILTELSYFIEHSSNEEFFDSNNSIYTKFYKENLIDYYIFNYFIYHQDCWNHNYFIVRDSYPSKFYLIPWDFDISFGQYLWKELDERFYLEYDIRYLNRLYDRLLGNKSFKEDLKIRWFELRNSIWSSENILNMLDEMYDEIGDVLSSEVNLWNMRSPILFREERVNDIEESIDFLYDWIEERLEFCDYYFSDMGNE
ncbi:MAG: hypothetical protein GF383_13115 [Candidatus Lokiarchaeota archaeon]|nr:hypothetical protein [Candidatus Lokiarchaeota archaeon]MBD3342069.1 hypothetical protein [Candidatus Lokiarchaeota archaeon]